MDKKLDGPNDTLFFKYNYKLKILNYFLLFKMYNIKF